MVSRNDKTDRRSLRSKQAILEAFQKLLLEKDVSNISVADIVERADIGRTTFYAHFEDIYDLQKFIFLRLLDQIEQDVETHNANRAANLDLCQVLIPSYALFKITEEKHMLFKKNVKTSEIGFDSLSDALISRFKTKITQLDVIDSNDGVSHHVVAIYLINALIALLTDWILNDMPKSAEEIDRIFQKLAKPTLSLFI